MSFHALNKTVSSLPLYFGGNSAVGKLLDLVAQEQRGLAIDTVSGKVLIRDRDNPAIDRLVDINPARNENRVLDYSGSPKMILDKNGKLRKTSINMLPHSNDLTNFSTDFVTTSVVSIPNQNDIVTTFIEDTADDSRHIILKYISGVALDEIIAATVKVRANGHNFVYVGFLGTGALAPCFGVVVNLITGSVYSHVGMTRGVQEDTSATVTALPLGDFEVKIQMKNVGAVGSYLVCGPSEVEEPTSFSAYFPQYTGTVGKGVYVWDAQFAPLDQSEIFVPCTQANQLEIPLNHKYNAATGLYEPNGILIEPQSTNLLANSQQPDVANTMTYVDNFDFGPFVRSGVVIPTVWSPASTYGYYSGTFVDTKTYTFSCYVYSDDGEPPEFNSDTLSSSTNSFGLYFYAVTTALHRNVQVKRITDKLFRISLSGPGVNTTGNFGLLRHSDNNPSARNFTVTAFQLEEGGVATSLIETSGPTVTRLADYPLAIDTSKFPYDPTKGTFIVEYADTDAPSSGILSSPNKSFLFRNVDPDQVATHTGTGGNNAVSSPRQTSGFQKAAITWGPTGSQLAHRGVSGPRQTNANNWDGISQITLGSRFTVVHAPVQIKSLTYVPIDRTQAQIESLTND